MPSLTIPQWAFDALLGIALAAMVVVLVRWTLKILGAELHDFIGAVRSEVADFRGRRKTVGALNWYGFITVALFGVVAIVAAGTQKVLGLLLQFLRPHLVNDLIAASNYFTLVFVLALVLVVSLVAVVIDNRSRGE
jgi:hypothetical protein